MTDKKKQTAALLSKLVADLESGAIRVEDLGEDFVDRFLEILENRQSLLPEE